MIAGLLEGSFCFVFLPFLIGVLLEGKFNSDFLPFLMGVLLEGRFQFRSFTLSDKRFIKG